MSRHFISIAGRLSLRRPQRDSLEILARVAPLWRERATEHELAHGGKPWVYLFIPHDEITANATLARLASAYTVTNMEVPG